MTDRDRRLDWGTNRPRLITVMLAGLLVLTGWNSTLFSDVSKLGNSPGQFSNPIISGFAPDPSICRSGDDFYLVNSTFEYFPGIPIYHSKDLVNWELISYAFHKPNQADMDSILSSGGIHATTIRCEKDRFYVITTNVLDNKPVNFILTADDPKGPWSDPYVLEGAPGIDPSLFFDDDGRVWYTGNHMPPDPEFDGQAEIWLQELDLETMQLVGERHFLWRGCCQGGWAEGPHIYKRDGYYYLLISEAGTSYDHAMSVAISKDITGPYQNNARNPILTHRQLSYDYPITGTGHADLVELADGRWYAVALAWRLVDGTHGILGRETFLLPVKWETEPYDWKEEPLTFPVFSPLTGRLELHYPTPFEGTTQQPRGAFEDTFDNDALHLEWNVRRTHDEVFHDLEARPGYLRLNLLPGKIEKQARYAFTGIRQRDFLFEASTLMEFEPGGENEEAGIIAILNDNSAWRMTLSEDSGTPTLTLTKSFKGEENEVASVEVGEKPLHLRIRGDYLEYTFEWSEDGDTWESLGGVQDGSSLSPAVLGGFNYTGVYLGLYASSNGQPTDNHADFDHFRYHSMEEHRDDWFHRQMKNVSY